MPGFTAVKLYQTSITIAIHTTDATDPKYITDPGCVKIGTFSIVIVPLPAEATVADDNREVTVKMDFSASGIFVTADDNTEQYHSEQTVDFLLCQKDTCYTGILRPACNLCIDACMLMQFLQFARTLGTTYIC